MMPRCCATLAQMVANEDRILRWSERYQEYSIPVHDGGTSGIVILYCPFCGIRLPRSRRRKGKG